MNVYVSITNSIRHLRLDRVSIMQYNGGKKNQRPEGVQTAGSYGVVHHSAVQGKGGSGQPRRRRIT